MFELEKAVPQKNIPEWYNLQIGFSSLRKNQSAAHSNIEIIQRFQNKTIRIITNALRYMSKSSATLSVAGTIRILRNQTNI